MWPALCGPAESIANRRETIPCRVAAELFSRAAMAGALYDSTVMRYQSRQEMLPIVPRISAHSNQPAIQLDRCNLFKHYHLM